MLGYHYAKAWHELISDLLAGASSGMEIPSYQDLNLVNYWFGTFLEEKLLKESKGIQVCLNYSHSQTECEIPIFPALLVLKSWRVICSASRLFLMSALHETPELKVGPCEPPRKSNNNEGILLFTRLANGKLLSIFLIHTTLRKPTFFYLLALKYNIDCTVSFVTVCPGWV